MRKRRRKSRCFADALAEQTATHAKIALKRVQRCRSAPRCICAHPFRGAGYEFDVPLLPGEHVTEDTGTGFVHTAPGHGEEDFELGTQAIRSRNPAHRRRGGQFYDNVPLFAGKRILTPDGKKDGDANGAVIKELIDAGTLLAKGKLRHQYPHSWRSKAPVIFRATPQWFIAMDKPIRRLGRQAAARARARRHRRGRAGIRQQGENRIGAMVKDRPDWVLSRQRAWGVPIAVFVSHKKTAQLLRDDAVNARIADAFEKEGADAWFNRRPARFLGDDYNAGRLRAGRPTFSTSGSIPARPTPSWSRTRSIRPGPKRAHADLYLEGSDQHRGWFQSSLLESCGTRGRAPYDAVLTHGFVLDEQGRKMSKSLGNTLAPQKVAEQNGAEILRLWAASSDFTEDLRIGPEIIKANVDSYRRLRNTIRFMLANLAGFDDAERIAA